MAKNKPTVLVSTDYYLPGYKGGGPIRTLANMADCLGSDITFNVVTRDTDFGNGEPYPGITGESWHRVGNAEVYYLNRTKQNLLGIYKLLNNTDYDILYLNSFFSRKFTAAFLLLRRLKLIRNVPVIVAPRGEFSQGAVKLKGIRKRLYIGLTKAARIYDGVTWQASSKYEEEDIRRWFGQNVRVVVAPDLPPRMQETKFPKSEKCQGSLSIIFLSRISRTKNLDGALKILRELKGKINFDIYGPLEDQSYWEECQKLIKALPSNIKVEYKGLVENNQVIGVFSQYHLFFMPTLGENFGHVIIESLMAGCPVLISDRTPWRNLEQTGVGWDFPLNRPDKFQKALNQCLGMDRLNHREFAQRAKKYALERSTDQKVIRQNSELFIRALSSS